MALVKILLTKTGSWEEGGKRGKYLNFKEFLVSPGLRLEASVDYKQKDAKSYFFSACALTLSQFGRNVWKKREIFGRIWKHFLTHLKGKKGIERSLVTTKFTTIREFSEACSLSFVK